MTDFFDGVLLTGNDLTFEQLYAVALRKKRVSLAPDAIERMKASRAVVDRLVASGATAYGINTGFGKLASVRISTEQVRQLQVNLVRSHACGVGTPLSELETRAMMLLRANALAKGLSGIRPQTVETLCAMLNAGVHPVIPSQGSVGASGDLAPLAHMAAAISMRSPVLKVMRVAALVFRRLLRNSGISSARTGPNTPVQPVLFLS